MGWLNFLRAADKQPVKSLEPQRLSVSSDFFPGMGVSSIDKIVLDRGLAAYRDMSRDAEVAADTDLRLAGMMPGAQIVPPDGSDIAKRSALFVDSVCSTMTGALLNTLRDQMLREAVVTGFFVAEPVEKIIRLPEFGGNVIGLADIRVRPSEGFTGRIKTDSSGAILAFEQYTMSGIKSATPDEVLCYAFSGSPWNPEGRSLYHAAYDYWRLKVALAKLFTMHMTVNASGIRELEIPAEFFEKDKVAAREMLRKLGETASIVRKDNQKLTLHIPQGTAGYHFIRGIRELCNAEIRKAILYDELISSEGQKTGSYASRKVSQSNVYNAMAAQGWAYCEAMAEQLFRRILDRNGYDTWPTPKLIPEPAASEQGNAVEILTSLSGLYQSGALTRPLDDATQDQIIKQILKPLGVESGTEAPIEDTTPDAQAHARERLQVVTGAAAPPGRTRADIMRLKKAAELAEKEGQTALLDTWSSNLPALKKAVNNALFDADGRWKTRDFGAVRKAIEGSVTKGGKELSATMLDMLMARKDAGYADAEKMVKVSAAVSVTPTRITPAQAQAMLKQHVYLTMGDTYTGMTSDIYYILENAIMGGISERDAMAQVSQYLTEKGLPPGRATTIVNTSLSQAYNQGRMELFSSIADPDGTTPGGIIGYQYTAVMDAATTDICDSYNGRFFKVDDPSLPEPPLHYNCRSVLIPVFSGEEPWTGAGWTSIEDSKSMTAKIPEGFGGN